MLPVSFKRGIANSQVIDFDKENGVKKGVFNNGTGGFHADRCRAARPEAQGQTLQEGGPRRPLRVRHPVRDNLVPLQLRDQRQAEVACSWSLRTRRDQAQRSPGASDGGEGVSGRGTFPCPPEERHNGAAAR